MAEHWIVFLALKDYDLGLIKASYSYARYEFTTIEAQMPSEFVITTTVI